MLAAMVAIAVTSANAQTTTPTTPTTTNNQTTTSSATTTMQNNANTANMPYSSQANYNAMDANKVPMNVQKTFGTDYADMKDAKWDSNDDVYRSSFKRDGKDMTVTYDKSGKMRESRTGMTMKDLPASVQTSMGKNANMPYEVKVGNQTYYSNKVDGKDMYYDNKGKAVKMPKMSNMPKK